MAQIISKVPLTEAFQPSTNSNIDFSSCADEPPSFTSTFNVNLILLFFEVQSLTRALFEQLHNRVGGRG